MLVAARENTLGGVVAKYTSPDLKTWKYEGTIYAPQTHYMLECPDIVCIGDAWYLTYSWDCVTYYAMSDSMYGPFVPPRDNILDGQGLTSGAGFIFYAAKPARMGDSLYLCGWLGQAGLSSDSGIYQWAGSVLVHEIYQLEDGKLGIKSPEILDEHFTVDKPVNVAALQGDVEVTGKGISLSSDPDSYALADLGTRPAAMVLECDVTMEQDGCVGFAFGPSDNIDSWSALCLDARRNVLHYEGNSISMIRQSEPGAITRFDFEQSNTHHLTLVCENEIVILYVDGVKALSSRITLSTNGAHIGVFVDGGEATFSNITMTLAE
jgi:beta-fructofuranosidase